MSAGRRWCRVASSRDTSDCAAPPPSPEHAARAPSSRSVQPPPPQGLTTGFHSGPATQAPDQMSPHTHTHPFNGPFSETTWVSRYHKDKTNLDFTEARNSEWQWHQLGRMQVCTSLQTDNHASTTPLSFLQAGCPSRHPTNSVKALKANRCHHS